MNEEQVKRLVEELLANALQKVVASHAVGGFKVKIEWSIKHAEVTSTGDITTNVSWDAESK